MIYLLDSNIVIAATMGTGDALRLRMAQCDEGDMVISSIVYAEILYGCVQGNPPLLERLQAFVDEVPIIDFDTAAATTYAGLPFRRASYDRLIAAHALSRGLVLVSDNVAHFADVPGLIVENWTL